MLISALTLTACGTSFPADPDGTLGRVSGGVLRVGASENDGWVTAELPAEYLPGGAATGGESWKKAAPPGFGATEIRRGKCQTSYLF